MRGMLNRRMKRRSFLAAPLIAALIWSPFGSAAHAAYFQGQTYSATYDQIVNFATYGGSPANSAAANSTAVNTFNTAYAAMTGRTLLVIDPGTYAMNGWTFGASGGVNLTISAYGVTINGAAGTNGLGGSGPNNDNTHNAKFTTTSAGASTISLVTSGQTSLFTVGKWVIVTGIDMQGYGYPQNPGLFEFKKILSIGSGTLTFTETLINSYKSTWPAYAPGDGVNLDQGGPGNVYVLRDAWDQEIEMKGATFGDNSNLQYGKCRVAQWTDCTFVTFGPCPTMSILFRSTRCTGAGTGGLEVDKCVHRMEFLDSMFRAVDFQSSSVNELYVSNMVQTGSNLRWRGGAQKSNTFLNCSFGAFSFGEMNYGPMGPTVMTNVSATSGDWFSSNVYPFSDYTEEGGGVLSYAGGPAPASTPNCYWAVPDANCVLLDGSNAWARSFQVTDVSQSGGRTYVTTNLPFPVPSPINGKSAPWRIANHPCPDLTMITCTGNALFVAQSLLPAHTPFQSWTL